MLTELQVKAAKPKEKSYMLRDDKGLYLRVDPSGRNIRFYAIGKMAKSINYLSAHILIYRSKMSA